MAKRKSKGNTAMAPSPSGPERKSVEMEEAENGYIVRVSHEGKNGYSSKRYVAFSQPEANRISAAGMSALSSKKKGGGKKRSTKHKMFASKKG
jgi:hypothetical protein